MEVVLCNNPRTIMGSNLIGSKNNRKKSSNSYGRRLRKGRRMIMSGNRMKMNGSKREIANAVM